MVNQENFSKSHREKYLDLSSISTLISKEGLVVAFKRLKENSNSEQAYRILIAAISYCTVDQRVASIANADNFYNALKEINDLDLPQSSQIRKDIKAAKPTILVWMESFHTTSHAERLLEIIIGLQENNVRVSVITSEDTIKTLTKSGQQTLQNFGFSQDTVFCSLPSQSTFKSMKDSFVSKEAENYYPYLYMEHPEIRKSRKDSISGFIDKLSNFPCITHILTEMWPESMCVFTDEILFIKQKVKDIGCYSKTVSIIRDIPFFDNTRFNNLDNELSLLETECDQILVRGDEGFLEQFFPLKRLAVLFHKTKFLGHLIYPGVPVRNELIEDKERRVLVSGVGSFNDAIDPLKNQDLQFYLGVIRAKKYSDLGSRNWVVLVSDKCPDLFFQLIEEEAGEYEGVSVLRQVPIMEHRQQIADSAVFVTITGYSAMLAGIAARVPTVSVPTEVFAYGDPDGVNDRLIRTLHYDRARTNPVKRNAARPAWHLPIDSLADPKQVAQIIDYSYYNHDPNLSDNFDFDGAQNAIDIILEDFINN